MRKINSFEDLEVWQLSMALCTEIYALTNTDLFAEDFGLKNASKTSKQLSGFINYLKSFKQK